MLSPRSLTTKKQQGALNVKISLQFATLVATVLSIFLTSGQLHAQKGTNVAVLDVGEVFEHHASFKANMEAIKSEIEAFENTVKAERKRLTTESEKLKDFNAGSPEYKQIETRLAGMSADLQVRMQLKRKEFLEREAQVYFQAYNDVVATVAEFSQRYGIGLVLRFNGKQMDATKRDSVLQGVNRAVVYQNKLNITSQIIERLNRGAPPVNVGGRPLPQRRN